MTHAELFAAVRAAMRGRGRSFSVDVESYGDDDGYESTEWMIYVPARDLGATGGLFKGRTAEEALEIARANDFTPPGEREPAS